MEHGAHEIDAEGVAALLGVSDGAVCARLEAMDLSPQRRDSLRGVAGEIVARADRFTAILYERFRVEPEIAELVRSDVQVERLRRRQIDYLRQLVSAPIDRSYVLDRLRLGLVHHRLRLTPSWYLATYSHFLCDHVDLLLSATGRPANGVEHVITLLKTILFDAGLALQAYGYSEERDVWTSHHRSVAEAPSAEVAPQSQTARPSRAREISRLRLDTDMIATRRRYIGITDDDRRALAALAPIVEAAAPAVMEDFYGLFSQQPETADLVPAESIARLKKQVSEYWHEITCARFDRAYAASRMRIGVVHERIGLSPHWYFAGVARQAAGFLRAMQGDAQDIAAGIKALVKAIFFDMTLVIDAYMDARVEALLRTDHYAGQLVANMAAAVAVLDASGRVQSANQALLRLLGIEPAILYLMPAEQAFRVPQLSAILDRSRRDPNARIIDVVRLNGRDFRIAIMPMNEGDKEKRAQRVVVLDDVSEILRLVNRAERSATGFDAAIAATRAVIWEMTLPEGTIEAISQTVIEVLGLRDVDLLGRSSAWLASIVEEDRAVFARHCAALGPNERTEIEHRMRRVDGREIWVRSTLVRYDESDSRPLIFGLTVDTTVLRDANRRSNEAILQAQRMAIVGSLAGGLAHDFNNTLTVITANLEMALPDITDRRAYDGVARALAAAEVSAGLNRRLLTYARRGERKDLSIEINQRLAGLFDLLAKTLGSDVTLETELAADLWPTRLDPADFDSAILNLAINARDAMPRGGTVVLRSCNIGREASRSVVGTLAGADLVCVSVRDTGLGMPADILSRATEPFFSTKSGPASAGLGLHSVRQFVEGVGGQLVIESEVGSGTNVALYMPRAVTRAPVDAGVGLGGVIATGDGEVVLVVEGSEAVLRATAMQLEGLGYAVAMARDAESALAILESGEPIELALIDMAVPGGTNGLVLAQRIRTRWSSIGIVLMSADHAAVDVSVPAERVILKPFARAKLAEVVGSALRDQSRGNGWTSPTKT